MRIMGTGVETINTIGPVIGTARFRIPKNPVFVDNISLYLSSLFQNNDRDSIEDRRY